MPLAVHLRFCEARNLRPSTIEQRRRVLTRLQLLIGSDLLAATPDQWQAWWDGATVRLAPESRATELAHARGFYRWAIRELLLERDPTNRLVRPILKPGLPNPMPGHDMERALADAPTRIRPWLYLAAYAGLRCCEIAPLRAEHLRFRTEAKVILIAEQKGGAAGSITAPPALVAALDGLPKRGVLFPRLDGRPGPVAPYYVSQLGNRYLHSIGIEHTMHSLRHWYGTEMYRASGRDLRQTQQALRHRSVLSTQRYTWVDPGELAGIASRLPGAGAAMALAVAAVTRMDGWVAAASLAA